MATWTLVPCLVQLRTEFNLLAPGRGKASDGSVGDLAHQDGVSDHNPDETGTVPIRDADSSNEVHAIDVDKDLNESDLTMEKIVQFLLARCRAGTEKRLRYIIFNRRIWSASSGWVQKTYTGSNPHAEHAHFSASYESKHEASAASWHLEEIPVSMTKPDRDFIEQAIETRLNAAKQEIKQLIESRVGDVVDRWYGEGADDPANVNPNVMASTALAKIGDTVADLQKKLDTLLGIMTPPAAGASTSTENVSTKKV